MTKVFFAPFSIVSGLLAGLLGKKIFEQVWSKIEDSETPQPEHREISVLKLGLALALEGMIFRAVRGLADHGARRAFSRMTGAWPGEERPEPE